MTQPGPPDPGHEPRPYFPSAGQGPVPGPPPASGGSYWLGLALGFLCWGVPPIALLFGLGDVTVAGVLGTVTMVLAVVGLIAASVLTAMLRTRKTGAGMFIALGVGPIVAAGVCITVLVAMNGY